MSQEITANYISVAAAAQALVIPADCAAGVLANITLFLDHARIVAAADQPETDPAELLRP